MRNNVNLGKYGFHSANNNDMTRLLNKIALRLQLGSNFPLPDGCKKDDWAGIILDQSISTFSQYFPHQIQDVITPNIVKNGYFFIDQNIPEGTKILGIKDIDWLAYRSDSRFDRYGINLDAQTWMTRQYAIDDIAMTTIGNDLLSLFDLGIFIEYYPPNKCRLVSVNGNPVSQFRPFPLIILVEHPGLWTISPTMMETFIKIAMCDIATLIYGEIKYYDGLDTVYAQLDLKLDTLQEWANKREDILREYDEAHNTTANDAAPVMITV